MVIDESVTTAAASRLIASIGSSEGGYSTSTSMSVTPATVRVVLPMPSIRDAELGEEEAEVLDHVVRRGVADDGRAGVAGGRQQDVLGHRVAALGEDDRPLGTVPGTTVHS